ncbi:sporulation membrane protein YtrI [Salsuginibacillus kocurii]|uniref:sporulation membrane protein YtrI n=1 Tax=Salsuginibacillus kocurii TaxID=427078 RepID=UPI00037AFC98|nr:sporulation membrane protein YtrI [Salsuginibacillus kocurii]
MRIPPLYRTPGAQRFFAGLFVGVLTGWFFFLLQYGTMHETLLIEKNKQEITITQLEEQIEALRQDERTNEGENPALIVEEIEFIFKNREASRLNELTIYELEQQALREIHFVQDQNVESVADLKESLIRTLENKTFEINEQTYNLDVKEMYLYTSLEIHVEIHPVNPGDN